ncbi:signal peptidase II [Chryseolinea sp. T2]|uniref:signal peptidase II n=1 Tax=Chryseolinea sp. T2 TaxID=3129255 RepID=UPI0030787ADF
MKASRVTRLLLIATMLLCNFGCDQLSKHIVRKSIANYQEIPLVKGHLTLTKVENTGAFLSFGHGLPQQLKTVLLAVLPLLALAVAILYLLFNDRITYLRAAGICFLVGGGLGNIIDRLFYGSVTDFLHLKYGNFQTGIFNLADVSIVIGLLIILFTSYTRKVHEVY